MFRRILIALGWVKPQPTDFGEMVRAAIQANPKKFRAELAENNALMRHLAAKLPPERR